MLAALGAFAAPAFADRPDVSYVRFGEGGARTRIVIESDRAPDYSVFTLAERRDRVVVDLERVRWMFGGAERRRGEGAGSGFVDGFRFAHHRADASRIVFDLNTPVRVARQFVLPPAAGAPRYRLVVDLVESDRQAFIRQSQDTAPMRASVSEAAPRRRDDHFVIVLDPGHGGRDPGASGVDGLEEADINLLAARELRDRLRSNRDFRVVMTRDSDTYVDLEDRVDIARNAGADLFISLHADSSGGGAHVRGASVYTLAERAEARARTDILARENWLIDVDFEGHSEPVTNILVDLAQRDTQNQSAAFADLLIPHLGRAGPLLRNTHRNGGLYVLLAPDVPAVLVEMGFLSNAEDEARLSDPRRRARIIAAIESAIEDYYHQRARRIASR